MSLFGRALCPIKVIAVRALPTRLLHLLPWAFLVTVARADQIIWTAQSSFQPGTFTSCPTMGDSVVSQGGVGAQIASNGLIGFGATMDPRSVA